MIGMIRFLLSVYALMQLVHFALPYVSSVQRPWMATLARFCEPGVKIGNQLIAKLIPQVQMKIEAGPLAAAAICYLVRAVLGIFFR